MMNLINILYRAAEMDDAVNDSDDDADYSKMDMVNFMRF